MIDFWKRYLELKGDSSEAEIARQLGISPSTLNTWLGGAKRKEKDQRIPKVPMAIRLAQILNTTVEYLYTGEKEEKAFYSDEEKNLIEMFRQLNEREKQHVISSIRLFLDKKGDSDIASRA